MSLYGPTAYGWTNRATSSSASAARHRSRTASAASAVPSAGESSKKSNCALTSLWRYFVVAKATGQSTELDPEVGETALAWGRENIKPEFRGEEGSGKVFGLEVPVSPDAPLYDRLAGFFGRDPSVAYG